MYYIDTHTHLNELTWVNLEQMYLAGIRTIVTPIQYDAAHAVSAEIIRETWDYLFDIHIPRAENNLIKAYGLIGISMVSTPKDDPAGLFEILPEYLKRPDVVGIGEIGFEPGSKTCNDLKFQEELFEKQLLIAKEVGISVVVHVPNPPDRKQEFTQRSLALCQKCKIPMEQVVIDHCTGVNIKQVLDSGAHAAISVQPWRGITPSMAADWVSEYGPDRMMIDSDCSSGWSDPFAVTKTAAALKQKGVSDEIVERVCWSNGRKFYGI
jgi:predicted metal-dependent TIM-barrel fold hydrolase